MSVPGSDSLSYFQIVKPVNEASNLFEWEEFSTNKSINLLFFTNIYT